MMDEHVIRPLARMQSDFPTKFGIPRQAGIVKELEGRIVFEAEYRNADALRGLEEFSHIWVIWGFSESPKDTWSPTVRPPRLGGNERRGVFATRSPFRPNGLGLSCLRLIAVETDEKLGCVLRVAGGDLMDGSPIFDVKPYIPYADSHPEASCGFAPDAGAQLELEFSEALAAKLPRDKLAALKGVLANDPRPRYQTEPLRVYGLEFAGMEIKFRVEGKTLRVVSVEMLEGEK